MANIYVQEGKIEHFPKTGHDLIPPLFVDKGIMPDRKGGGKTKRCKMLVNLAGVFFLRPIKLSKEYKLSLYVPIYQIIKVVYNDSKRRTIVTRAKEIFYECTHPDELLAHIIASRQQLYAGIQDPNPIQVEGFVDPPQSISIPVPDNVSMLRYLVFCIRYEIEPDDQIIQLFSSIDPNHHPFLTFSNQYACPPNLKCFIIPVIQMGKLRRVHFHNFAPYGVCRLAHHFLKHGSTINAIYFEGYQTLTPSQLRLNKVSQTKLLSFVFNNCHFSDTIFLDLMDELAKFQGEYTRLSFNGTSFSATQWNSLLQTIQSVRSFKTLEFLELNNIGTNDFTGEQVSQALKTVLTHNRYIQRLSVSNWSTPINIDLASFVYHNGLCELDISKQDMTQPLPETLRFYNYPCYLDFSGCSFTFISLQSLFKVLSFANPKMTPISLNLSDIQMPEAHWSQFFQELATLPKIKCLRELYWNGNPVEGYAIDNFVHYFFDTNSIKFLSIDRVFGSQRLEDIRHFFHIIGPNKLFGISVCGDDERNFGGNIKAFIEVLEILGPMYILHLDHQKISEIETSCITDYLQNHSQIVELSVDGTSISQDGRLFDFYAGIFEQHVQCIGRPNDDLDRLITPTLQGLSDSSRYDSFRSGLHERAEILSNGGRSYYLCRFEATDKFDPVKYYNFVIRYPLSFFDYTDEDHYFLYPTPNKIRFPSLCSLKVRGSCKTLSDIQNVNIVEPTKIPHYRCSPSFIMPPCFREGEANYRHGATPMNLRPITIPPQAKTEFLLKLEDEETLDTIGIPLPPPTQYGGATGGGGEYMGQSNIGEYQQMVQYGGDDQDYQMYEMGGDDVMGANAFELENQQIGGFQEQYNQFGGEYGENQYADQPPPPPPQFGGDQQFNQFGGESFSLGDEHQYGGDTFDPNQFGQNQLPDQNQFNQFGADQNQFGTDPNQLNQFGADQNQFGTDQNQFVADPNQFVADPNQFGADPNQFNQFGTDNQFNQFGGDNQQFDPNQFNQFSADPNQFVADPNQLNQFGADPNQFGADPNQFGADPNQFGADPNQFGADPNQFGADPNQFVADPNQLNQFGADPNQFGGDQNFGIDPNQFNQPFTGDQQFNVDPNQFGGDQQFNQFGGDQLQQFDQNQFGGDQQFNQFGGDQNQFAAPDQQFGVDPTFGQPLQHFDLPDPNFVPPPPDMDPSFGQPPPPPTDDYGLPPLAPLGQVQPDQYGGQAGFIEINPPDFGDGSVPPPPDNGLQMYESNEAYESNEPELPQLSAPVVPIDPTLADVKPLLSSNIKPRDKEAQPATTQLPTMATGIPPPQQPAGGFGIPPPQQPAGGFGIPPPQQPAGGFGIPPPATGGFGIPPPATGGFGIPPPATGGFGIPPPAAGGFGIPPPQAGITMPPPLSSSIGAPPQLRSGVGVHPVIQSGPGVPPPLQSGLGMRTLQMPGQSTFQPPPPPQ